MASRRHILGLDTCRFIAAFWVALSHGLAFPLKSVWLSPGPFGHILIGVYDCLFNGTAAVIVFFIISGFCIHYPWIGSQTVDIRAHFIRRYVRIGLPLLAVLLLTQVSTTVTQGVAPVIWSVYCELIYYFLYPALFIFFRKFGIRNAIAISTLVATFLILSHRDLLYEWDFGIALTWLVAMPAWLLGCLLAERMERQSDAPASRHLWIWRMVGLAYTTASVAALFHGPIKIGYPITMLPFAFFAFLWLEQELMNFVRHPPLQALEWAGTWSYSIYLVHNIVIQFCADLNLPSVVTWCIDVPAALIASYIFAQVIEFPAHRLARKFTRSLTILPIEAAAANAE